jgi:hypothetical protein
MRGVGDESSLRLEGRLESFQQRVDRVGELLELLTHTQRCILELLQITPPWLKQQPADLALS